MSVFDKAVAAVTPPESQQKRDEARTKARAAAPPGGWLSMILDHHLQIEDAFAAVKSAGEPAARTAAQKKLGVIVTGHAIAEEAVIYPALAQCGERGHADMGYTEQVAVKMQLAKLETLDPMSQDYLDKLEHIRGAVAHHMYEEEGSWLLELSKKAPADVQDRLTRRYAQEFDRYVGHTDESHGTVSGAAAREPRSWDDARP